MSKQFESKKEAVSLINRSYQDRLQSKSADNKLSDLERKFNLLSDRTKQLEKVFQFHKGIVQNITSGIITIDGKGIITFINSAALKVLDYNYSELVNTDVKNLFVDPKEAVDILNKLIEKKEMFESKEVNLHTKYNQIIPIGFSTSILESNKSVFEGVIILFRDLTKIRNLRRQMARMDRLATLGEVSAGIAHEVRNPLAGIKTSAQVLEESFAPNDFRSQLVSRIIKEIDRANDLLKKFFKFAKPARPEQSNINIEKLLDGVNLLLLSKMKKSNIKFITKYDNSLPEVFIDEAQIEQVIMNLVLNAIDSIEANGEIIITTGIHTKSDELKSTGDDEKVFVEITDTGKGIDEENIEKIFNPFFTTKSNGLGLGLAISSRLIEENGAKLEVESKVGQGTTFRLYLPTKSNIGLT